MFCSNKLCDQFIITQNKLGTGAFGSVYVAKIDNKEIAVKCESKESNNLTLFKEFKIGRKLYIIKKNFYNIIFDENSKNNKFNIESSNNIDNIPIIKIYKYICSNNLLSIPSELDMQYFVETKCIPETYSYIECNDFNFLTMELCGENFEKIMEKYIISESGKYFIAHKLLHTLSCLHRMGIVHRDIKLNNIVLNINLDNTNNYSNIYPIIIDLGLAKEYYKYEGGKVLKSSGKEIKSIVGTLRYISLNVHEYKAPTIVDDLISLCYALIVIFTNKSLPWVAHKKDLNKFDVNKHTFNKCKCGYHKNKSKGITKANNTIAEVKFHTSIPEIIGNYHFLGNWLKYLYGLNKTQLPSYNILYKMLKDESCTYENLCLEITKK